MAIDEMAFDPATGLLDTATYPTNPESETAARTQVQAGMNQLRDYINDTLLAALQAVADGAAGADQIGMTAITETGEAATVQAVVEALITRLKATDDSASGADLIAMTAISGWAGATVQAIMEAAKTDVDGKIAKTLLSAAGDIMYASDADTPARLAKGTALQGLLMNAGATAPEWGASLQSILTAAGDIVYASSANTPARLAKGTALQYLMMNAGATAPEWAAGVLAAGGTYAGDDTNGRQITVGFQPKFVALGGGGKMSIMVSGTTLDVIPAVSINPGNHPAINATGFLTYALTGFNADGTTYTWAVFG